MKTFKEISVGGVPRDALIQRLVEAGVQFNDYARMLFQHRAFSPGDRPENVTLMRLTTSDLKLDGPCSLRKILEGAAALGLRPCPLSLAGFLRLAYMDQPEGPYLTIASPPPEEDENHPTGFYIRNINGSLWLRGYRVTGEPEWPPENEFIFLK